MLSAFCVWLPLVQLGQSGWSSTPDTAVQSSWPWVPQQGSGKGYLLF